MRTSVLHERTFAVKRLSSLSVEGYAPAMKTIWTTRINQTAAKYGDQVPMAAACCNVCRTCVQTNVLGLASAAIVGGALAVVRFFRPSAAS